MDSVTLRFVAWPRGSLEKLSDSARDNLEAVVWNAVTCLSQHEHGVPGSRGCVTVATHSVIPKHPAFSMSHIICGSAALPFKVCKCCLTCLTKPWRTYSGEPEHAHSKYMNVSLYPEPTFCIMILSGALEDL